MAEIEIDCPECKKEFRQTLFSGTKEYQEFSKLRIGEVFIFICPDCKKDIISEIFECNYTFSSNSVSDSNTRAEIQKTMSRNDGIK
ncbi:MAG: hypothetical protein ACPKQO_10050 [Nitrososphaeraceae archaeon]